MVDLNNSIDNGILTYYSASVVQSKIVTHKETTRLSIIKADRQSKYIASKYLTRQDAIDAIKVVLPRAQTKFETCQAELKALKDKLGFCVGRVYDGDSHGIYNEYSYISFKLDGFNFEFEIKE